MICRQGAPGIYDQLPRGTICKSLVSLHDNFEIYIQLSSDENNPQWHLMGSYPQDTKDEDIQLAISNLIDL